MNKKWAGSLVVFTLILILGIGILYLYSSNSLTGFVSFGEERNGCSASLGNETSVQLDALFLKKNKINLKDCQSLFSTNSQKILDSVCANSIGLGDISVSWGKKELGRINLDCVNSKTTNYITSEGEFGVLFAEDTTTGLYKEIPHIKDKSGNVYELRKKDSDSEFFKNYKPGDKVKVRAKKSFRNEIVLEFKDERSIRKI